MRVWELANELPPLLTGILPLAMLCLCALTHTH